MFSVKNVVMVIFSLCLNGLNEAGTNTCSTCPMYAQRITVRTIADILVCKYLIWAKCWMLNQMLQQFSFFDICTGILIETVSVDLVERILLSWWQHGNIFSKLHFYFLSRFFLYFILTCLWLTLSRRTTTTRLFKNKENQVCYTWNTW